jgi:hypothetical protein
VIVIFGGRQGVVIVRVLIDWCAVSALLRSDDRHLWQQGVVFVCCLTGVLCQHYREVLVYNVVDRHAHVCAYLHVRMCASLHGEINDDMMCCH